MVVTQTLKGTRTGEMDMNDPTDPGSVHLPPSRSIAARAALAVALMIGFYTLAIAISAGLLLTCYLMIRHGHRIPGRLLVFCVLGAGSILWSILPRRDRFDAPGPELVPGRHPRLFREIEGIARATGQDMPEQVYLVGDVNAWVAQRGGVMGIGSRRVMGLGLPLLRVLTISELRAVLAHEFGHYHGGDTRLGPWIYKTRSAIIRTVQGLGGILRKPFIWYGTIFLRVTHAVSRRQELVADRLAATVVGSAPLSSGLRRIHGAAVAFALFWRQEVVPMLSAGYRPPVAEGFAQFLQAPRIVEAVEKAVETELRDGRQDPYDTHPPLSTRIAEVRELPSFAMDDASAPAISLLEDLPTVERDLLMEMGNPEEVRKLRDTRWEDAGQAVYIPAWRDLVRRSSQLLEGLTPVLLRDALALRIAGKGEITDEMRQRIAAVGAALALAALDAGALLEAEPGKEITVSRDGTRVEPFSVVGALVDGHLEPDVWLAQCEALGIRDADLAGLGQEHAGPE